MLECLDVNMILTIVIFIIILGLLVFVHEFGHFIAARKSGMFVQEFGFGFPPRLVGWQKVEGKWKVIIGHRRPANSANVDSDSLQRPVISTAEKDSTIYSINVIPLGGFVKIWGENNEHADDPRSFINKPFWLRLATLVAGVLMNVAFAWVLISLGFTLGIPTAIDDLTALPTSAKFSDPRISIIELAPQGPAQRAGLLPGDAILQIDGQVFSSIENLRDYIRANAGKTFEFRVKRAGAETTFSVESITQPPAGQGPTGIILAEVGILSFPWYISIWQGAKATVIQLSSIIAGLYHLFTTKVGLSALGGPVKIAQVTGQVADMGFIYLLQFTSFLSLNLAVLNILPFPALDGGRLLFLIIEKLRGKRNNPKIEQAINVAGFALLIFLMIAVTIKDVKGF